MPSDRVGTAGMNLRRKAKDQFNTVLPPDIEKEYKNFVADASLDTGRDYSKNENDYDLRGFFLEQGQSGLKASNTHGPDTYKKPNHPTFSNESKYSTPENPGGVWLGPNFMPSANQISTPQKVKKLKDYWSRVEQGKLLLPEGQ